MTDLQELLDSGRLLELNVGDRCDGKHVLEAVDDGVWSGGYGGVADSQTHGGQATNSLLTLNVSRRRKLALSDMVLNSLILYIIVFL